MEVGFQRRVKDKVMKKQYRFRLSGGCVWYAAYYCEIKKVWMDEYGRILPADATIKTLDEVLGKSDSKERS